MDTRWTPRVATVATEPAALRWAERDEPARPSLLARFLAWLRP